MLIARMRPNTLIVQNPSLFLAAFAVIFRGLFGYNLVVDRHTNFMINKPDSIKKRVFCLIGDFSLRGSNLTIVTNKFLAELVKSKGGKAFILPDPLPQLEKHVPYPVASKKSVCFICTYASDEPYNEVIAATRLLPEDVSVYITGKYSPNNLTQESRDTVAELDNLFMTGFLSDAEYSGLLNTVDVVMDLTTLDHCLVCGAYEAIAIGKPLILSEKEANRELFGNAPVYINHSAIAIQTGITLAFEDLDSRTVAMNQLRTTYESYWGKSFSSLQEIIAGTQH